jgi:hypothetical protein
MIKARLDGESLEACNRIGDEAVARWRTLKESAGTGRKGTREADRRTARAAQCGSPTEPKKFVPSPICALNAPACSRDQYSGE